MSSSKNPPPTQVPETKVPNADAAASVLGASSGPESESLVLRLVWTGALAGLESSTPVFDPGETACLVGRGHGLNPDLDPEISREQFELRRVGSDGLKVRHMGKYHPTLVDGVATTGWVPLKQGSVVRVRDHLFVVQRGIAPDEPEDEVSRLLIGVSPAMAAVRENIRRYGAFSSSVLLLGETGTGKDVVARALAAFRPPLTATSAPLLGSLADSKLFGHLKGSFTGAVTTQKGLFEEAGDGTLFIDEVGELSADVQPKLLRVLESRRFERIGEPAEHRAVGARILFATLRDLTSSVEKGTFRDDLFARIRTLKIELPPLREHREDIPELAAHFMAQHAAQEGRPPRALSTTEIEFLLRHAWPDNTRGVRIAMARALAGEPMKKWVEAAPPATPRPAALVASALDGRAWHKLPLVDLTAFIVSRLAPEHAAGIGADDAKEAILRLVVQHGGKLERACESLGVNPNSKGNFLQKCGWPSQNDFREAVDGWLGVRAVARR